MLDGVKIFNKIKRIPKKTWIYNKTGYVVRTNQ